MKDEEYKKRLEELYKLAKGESNIAVALEILAILRVLE